MARDRPALRLLCGVTSDWEGWRLGPRGFDRGCVFFLLLGRDSGGWLSSAAVGFAVWRRRDWVGLLPDAVMVLTYRPWRGGLVGGRPRVDVGERA